MDYEMLKLKNQLCFPLYAASKEVIRMYKPFLDKINLTYTQYITMLLLWEHKELRVKELGDYLFLDSGTLTPLLKKLEKQELIIRKRQKEDERNMLIMLTQKGEELKEQAIDIPLNVRNCVSIDEKEAKNLYEILYKLLNQNKE